MSHSQEEPDVLASLSRSKDVYAGQDKICIPIEDDDSLKTESESEEAVRVFCIKIRTCRLRSEPSPTRIVLGRGRSLHHICLRFLCELVSLRIQEEAKQI